MSVTASLWYWEIKKTTLVTNTEKYTKEKSWPKIWGNHWRQDMRGHTVVPHLCHQALSIVCHRGRRSVQTPGFLHLVVDCKHLLKLWVGQELGHQGHVFTDSVAIWLEDCLDPLKGLNQLVDPWDRKGLCYTTGDFMVCSLYINHLWSLFFLPFTL